MSIALLNSCYELRKWNQVLSALHTQARTQIVFCLALYKLQNWIFISTRANQRHLIQTVLTENWLLDKINIFMRMLSKKKKKDVFTKKKFSPFLFSTSPPSPPPHGFRHIYTYIPGIQRCHRKFLVLFVLRFLCCTTSSVLIWSYKLEGRWGCFTGNIIQAEIQGLKKKKKVTDSCSLFSIKYCYSFLIPFYW